MLLPRSLHDQTELWTDSTPMTSVVLPPTCAPPTLAGNVSCTKLTDLPQWVPKYGHTKQPQFRFANHLVEMRVSIIYRGIGLVEKSNYLKTIYLNGMWPFHVAATFNSTE